MRITTFGRYYEMVQLIMFVWRLIVWLGTFCITSEWTTKGQEYVVRYIDLRWHWTGRL